MDVDLLRPGSVPISPDTVLWFEFLLDNNLLIKHLQKPHADPTPVDLITKLYDVIGETLRIHRESEVDIAYNPETCDIKQNKPEQPAKIMALKILSLKVAAFLKWNLAEIRSLPFKTQIDLLQDLMYFTNDNKVVMEIPNIEDVDIKSTSTQFLFALLVFHRWLLNTSMHRITSNRGLRYGIHDMTPAEENIICCPQNIEKTIKFLNEALEWDEIPGMITFDCFNLPTEAGITEFKWEKVQNITKNEFGAQINYDLGTFFFYTEEYQLAKQNFSKCLTYYGLITENNGFSNFEKDILDVYLRACDINAEGHKKSLLEQLNGSIVNQYMGITNILQQDNIQKEIPLSHRLNIELDVQGALSSGAFTVAKDLLMKIKSLNMVRCILDKRPLFQYSINNTNFVDTLIWAMQVTWNAFSENDKSLLKTFLIELILKDEVHGLLNKLRTTEEFCNIFDKAELKYISKSEESVDIPDSLINMTDLTLCDFSKKRKPQFELRQLEKQLIATYNYKEIMDILRKIAMTNIGTSAWNLNLLWELPIPLHSVIKSLPRGFLQDYSYVLLAKSKEQLLNKNWNLALELLIVLDKELLHSTGNFQKLHKMASWEVLLIQITQLLDEWPKASVDKTALANACEVCLQTNDSVLPRSEITDACAICLLNLGRWEFLIDYEKRWSTFEITAAIALACHEIVKYKGTKKFSKNLWDIVLPVFSSSQTQSKRTGFHDANNLRNNIMAVFCKLKDSCCFAVAASMLTKMYNLFKDETNLELQIDYANNWPSSVSNANSYNAVAAIEMLSEIVVQALVYYPTNVSWLRLMGDINFANGNYQISVAYYLKSLLLCNDYFNIPIRNDDHVFRRMIKCCMALGCHTQASVLCQFLEEPDYALAFRILSDQKTCNDAVDAYYHCFWDTNILEFLIHIHNRRGEFQRRKCAIQVMGMLELNSNNNEEIQREASNLRKSIFLRALCKQYLF